MRKKIFVAVLAMLALLAIVAFPIGYSVVADLPVFGKLWGAIALACLLIECGFFGSIIWEHPDDMDSTVVFYLATTCLLLPVLLAQAGSSSYLYQVRSVPVYCGSGISVSACLSVLVRLLWYAICDLFDKMCLQRADRIREQRRTSA